MHHTIAIAVLLVSAASAVAQQPALQRVARVATSYGANMVLDLARQRPVMVCGDDTFEWMGNSWVHRAVVPGLSIQNDTLTYDSQRGVCVLFGTRQQTWEFDGRDWHQRHPSTNAPMQGARLAYDPSRNRTVGFSGVSTSPWQAETWEWDGTNWTPIATALHPLARAGHAMAFDPAGPSSLLFGGVLSAPGNYQGLADTWSWNGAAWTQHATAVAPPARWSHAMTTDLNRGRVVLFGGYLPGAVDTYYDDTWEWDGSVWTQAQPQAHPSSRSGSAIAGDNRTGRVLLFGGYDGLDILVDTWSWDGTAWRTEARELPQESVGTVVADRARGQLLAFGGTRGRPLSRSNETWIGDGVRWSQRNPALSPSPRYASLVDDEARRQVLLFGGYSNTNSLLQDTWTWDGIDWTRHMPTVSPPPGRHPMVYDTAHQVVTLCEASSSNIEIWQWDGSNWSLRPTSIRPPPRLTPAIAYDAARQQLVLFGGYLATCGCCSCNVTNFGDTWLWNGSTWTQSGPVLSPAPRAQASLIYDPTRHVVRLNGGSFLYGLGQTVRSLPLTDVWEWDGTQWTGPWAGSQETSTAQTVFEPGQQRILLLAWRSVSTWTTAPNERTGYGIGCAGSRSVPWLTCPPATLGNGGFALEVGSVPANAPVLVGLSFLTGNTPISPGCTLRLGPLATILLASGNLNGFASAPAAIPSSPFLRGLQMHAQALALDPGAPAGFSVSPGLRVVVGD